MLFLSYLNLFYVSFLNMELIIFNLEKIDLIIILLVLIFLLLIVVVVYKKLLINSSCVSGNSNNNCWTVAASLTVGCDCQNLVWLSAISNKLIQTCIINDTFFLV